MQIKTTMRYHLTPVRPSSKGLQTTNAGEGVEKTESSYTGGENVNWYSHDREQYGSSLKKLKIELPHDPILLLPFVLLSFTATRMDPEIITRSEVRETQVSCITYM